jgi:hypothetical protein
MSVDASRRESLFKRKRNGVIKRDQTLSEAQGTLPSMTRGIRVHLLAVFWRADVMHRHAHVNSLADSLPQLRSS